MKAPNQCGVAVEDPPSQRAQLLASLKTFVVVVGTSAVALIAFRNTLTWHLQRFWGASGDFWQSQWEKIIHLFGGDEFYLTFLGSFLVPFLVYWCVGGFYCFVDLTGRPKFLLRYKIQDNTQYPIPIPKLWKVVKQVLINQILVGFPFIYVASRIMKYRGYDWGPKLPTFQWVIFELSICILLEELMFYYSHRFLHHPKVYKYIHKRHHEWTAPIAITAVYSHPIEHILSNYMPVVLGPLVLGSHVATSWLWFSIAILSTLNAHSGYHLPFFPSPEAHDFHHLKFNQNFGVLGVLDRLHGTDSMFRKSKAYQRHIMLLSLVPIKQLLPDDKKNGQSCSTQDI
jgi:sterol desaturase/sphingolipid hydroxylase (fatty acid hydroxylase superfamily)